MINSQVGGVSTADGDPETKMDSLKTEINRLRELERDVRTLRQEKEARLRYLSQLEEIGRSIDASIED